MGRGNRPVVIVLSGDGRRETRQRALDLGASDFVVKPFQRDDMVRRMRWLLVGRGSRTSEP